MATFTTISLMVTIVLAFCSAAPNKNLGLKIPDECKGKGFCSIKPEGYDEMQDMVNELLSTHFIAQNVGDRIGDEENKSILSNESDWHNCPYIESTEIMYAYSSSNESDADYIIQHDLHRQPIKTITCANENIQKIGSQECFQHLGLSNTKSTCVSSTVKRSLLVLDYNSKKIKQKSYDVPCCCTCQINSSF